jgi:hypothetical protein
MNWGIRIAVILVILGGLVWLNWDRFSEENRDHPTQMLEGGVVDQAENLPFIRDTESDQKDRDTYNRSMADTAPIASKLPAFELQASPESLNDSDTQVRSVTEELSPEATEWLKPDEQLRKWALLVAQAAEGNTLYTGRPFTFKLAEFALEERGERYFVSTQNFDRYGVIINVLANLPADKLVAYYRDWYPLLEEAFGELGLPGSFDEQVDSMIERILAVEVLLPPIELKKPTSVTYKFLDPKLEAASQIDKWLWRMGPENTRKIQSFANRLKREFVKN